MQAFFSLLLTFFFLIRPVFAAADTPITVSVAIPPQAFVVERIGGERVKVNVLLPSGKSPATYKPSPNQMMTLSRSRLYFQIGLPFEKRLVAKMKNGMSVEIVDIRAGIKLVPMGDHRHGSSEPDPHIWMDPKLVIIQATTIRDVLIQADPDGRSEYERGYRSLTADLTALDHKLKSILQPLQGRTIYVFHPSYGYFCRAYGLVQKAVETGGKQPSPKHLGALIRAARKDKVKVIFVQPQFARRSAEAVAKAIGGAVIPLDPLAKEYIVNLEQMAEKIRRALSSPSPK